jgi:hypothetical protein
MVARLPERVRTPQVARAIMSPSAFLLAGAGTSVAILGGLPLLAAAGVGALCWATRVAAAVPRQPAGDRVDTRQLRPPWRDFVKEAVAAQRRFETACARTQPGPLRDHLTDLGRRLGDGVRESSHIARQAQTLAEAWSELDVAGVQREMADVKNQPASDSRDRTEAALKAQLDSANRIGKVADDARDRLRVLNAELDEAVARAIELSVQAADPKTLDPLAENVDSLVGELESLRQALGNVSGNPSESGPAERR